MQDLKQNERELIRQVNYFKKRAAKMLVEGKIGEEHNDLIQSCEKLVDAVQLHAAKRAEVLTQRESLRTMLKDNAQCPKCNKNTNLKLVGVDTSDKGWKSNKYKCRKCNIEFVWAKPNNPWDLVPYLEAMVPTLEMRSKDEKLNDAERSELQHMIAQIHASLERLKPVIEASDLDYEEMQARDTEMNRLVNEFKMHLQIERIKMDAQDN